MSRQMWTEAVAWTSADSQAITNSVSSTPIFPPISIPANYMADGRVLRIRAFGRLTMNSGGTIYLHFYTMWGVTSLNNWTTQFTAGLSAGCWSYDGLIQTRTNGANGALFAMGDISYNLSDTAIKGVTFGNGGWSYPLERSGLNLSAPTDLTLNSACGTASTSNAFQGHILVVESLN